MPDSALLQARTQSSESPIGLDARAKEVDIGTEMAPATEIATLSVIGAASLEKEGSPSYTIWQELLSTIASQDGYQRTYWGRRIEDQSVVSLLIGTT